MTSRLLLIDGIGPFFRHYDKKRINWSKIPFASLETVDGLKPDVVATIPEDFRKFIARARDLGYNGVTLDDVAHLVQCDRYDQSMRSKIDAYRSLMGTLIDAADQIGMSVYFTMDVMFFNDTIRKIVGNDQTKANSWLREKLSVLFEDFPKLAGVIVRFGESDGLDVKGDFRSELWLKRPSDARRFLQALLPVFERHERLLIFRTWSVGAYPIGDLNWNEKRFKQVFDGIDSRNLIISLKYGESDFFRYLPANSLFFVSEHQKIVEFQARREYEGFGAFPSFVGWDTEQILHELSTAKNVIGMSVWCQTGGWGKRRQLTFLRNSSIWVELNTHVLARLWSGDTCQEAIEHFVDRSLPKVPIDAMIDFLRASDQVIKDLLYIRELGERRLYFRRLRLPPQLFVYWDRILIDPFIRKALQCLVRDHESALRQGREAHRRLHDMVEIAERYGIPKRGLKLQLATFEIIAMAREFYFGTQHDVITDLIQKRESYRKRFKRNYTVLINVDPSRIHNIPVRWILPLMLRERRRYRMLDQVLSIRLLGLLYPLARRFRHRIGPKFAAKQAMGIDTLLK